MRGGNYLWHTPKSKWVIDEFKGVEFHKHPKIVPSTFNQIFKNREPKVDVDILKAKVNEHENVPGKQSLESKQIKSTVGYINKNMIGGGGNRRQQGE